LLQRAVFVIGRNDRIVYAEHVADQMREPDYAGARTRPVRRLPDSPAGDDSLGGTLAVAESGRAPGEPTSAEKLE
jgi:hypothetical protein